MRVRCVRIVHPQAGIPVAEFAGIRVGGVYTVLEVTTGADVQLRVRSEGSEGAGLLWDPEDFEIVEGE
jgi:hypothetical protein